MYNCALDTFLGSGSREILPPGVTDESDEQISTAMVADICHGILSLLMHVAGSLREG